LSELFGLTIVVPAFNEELRLGETLTSLKQAQTILLHQRGVKAEIIVVDNNSEDSTIAVARSCGARVMSEPVRNIARVRNTGATASRGHTIVFVDADTIVPAQLLVRIYDVMTHEDCAGGAVDTNYQPAKLSIRAYLSIWRMIGKVSGVAQGATQFCRREFFLELGGYDESLFMGEDVDFYLRLKRAAKGQRRRVVLIDDVKVRPSTRRFDQWRVWRTLLWTNPLLILMFQRREPYWQGWYRGAPR
jgi:glycosyltransferase involved in cell wall biosynthesis